MKTQQPVKPDRIRKIEGTFGFIEHRFIHEGFFHSLTHRELVLYVFLVLKERFDTRAAPLGGKRGSGREAVQRSPAGTR